jgi:hypothetical protein
MLFDVLFGHGKDERDHRERGTTIRFRGKLKEKGKKTPQNARLLTCCC